MKRHKDISEEIKEIIFNCAKKGGMCNDLIDGQIIGLRTGQGLEFDILAQELENWHRNRLIIFLRKMK